MIDTNTANAQATTQARQIPTQYDNRGNPVWNSRMSAPDSTVGECCMVPDRIIPVIFVPGVMGSNLRGIGHASGVNWTLNSSSSMIGWLSRDAADRKRALTPTTMEVDNRGTLPEGTAQSSEELRRRGWGEVGAMSYSTFLVWLENALNDFENAKSGARADLMQRALGALAGENKLTRDEVALSYRYRFPVHACGYNWLDTNVNAARRLGQRIDQIIGRYRAEKKRCEKVIVVTHSMGGLVARHCSQVLGYSEKIFGIVHGVMPAIGAAAVYRRFKSGTEGDYIASEVLGNDAAEMTAVLSSAPGPLQLLPTAEYGNGWLKIKDGAKEYTFPKNGDPYSEIYAVRGKWWSMCEDRLVNPLNTESDPQRHKVQVNADWAAYADLIKDRVRPFHEVIAGKYHPTTHAFFGSHADQRAYGNVTWTGNGGGWMRGDRQADVLNANQKAGQQINTTRRVVASLAGSGWTDSEAQTYTISKPDENGDGTVPHRSGVAPQAHVKSFLRVNVGHEPAYKHGDCEDCSIGERNFVAIRVKAQWRLAASSFFACCWRRAWPAANQRLQP
jgi:pimeloyl-ACP methyl ester carboxylesterase